MNNPFWDYSLAHYQKAQVADACLTLQDDCGLDVNVLLYGAWLASMGQRLQVAHLDALEREIVEWRERVVLPLRSLRREWRSYAPSAALREDLKALELHAEREQQDLMWAFYGAAPALPVDNGDLGGNLRLIAASGVAGQDNWEEPIARLASLLAE